MCTNSCWKEEAVWEQELQTMGTEVGSVRSEVMAAETVIEDGNVGCGESVSSVSLEAARPLSRERRRAW